MRILFCDDTPIALSEIQYTVMEYFSANGLSQPEYGIYTSGEELLARETKAAIAFLDVEMPGISGIHVGRVLKERNPEIKIIIVTSFSDYLDEAMRFQVFRYLSKPIDKNRVFRNLKDALYQHHMECVEVLVETMDRLVVRRSDEIVCVEGSKLRAKIITLDDTYDCIRGHDHWKAQLSLPSFISPFRAVLVNLKYVRDFTKEEIILAYPGGTYTVAVSRRRYTECRRKYLAYMGNIR